ncbi:MAG: CsbD family protein [Myxococcaceae bacterium]
MGEFIDKLKGRVKKIVGKASGDRSMQAEGHVDEAKGRAKGAFEEAKQGVKKVIRSEPSHPHGPGNP